MRAFTPDQIALANRLGSIFMPHAMRQLQDHYKGQNHARFVHYTSAEAALSIIKSKRIWMRNTNCMSDYREVQHGFDILQKFFSDTARGEELVKAFDKCAPGAAKEGVQLFIGSWNDIRFNTYITAVSEHADEEDLHGRLSMWRAFGTNVARVGLVFSIPLHAAVALPLKILFSSVAYLSEESAHAVLREVIRNVEANSDFLRTIDRAIIVQLIFGMLLSSVVCLKHEGFREEREWRAIYSPKRLPSTLMESSTEVVGGVPQFVYKIPIDATVSDSIADLDLSRIFDRLIIGPSPYPWPMYEAFVAALKQAGIEDAENRVQASHIPIRTVI
jgi:hypothetical protein